MIRNGNLGQDEAPETLVAVDCAQLVIVGCELHGSQAGFPGAGTALVANETHVQAYDTLFRGAPGALGQLGHGGHGARVVGGTLFASGCEFAPGDGGNGVTVTNPLFTICKDAGDGGSGVVLEASAQWLTPAFASLDWVLGAGAAGKATLPTCADGQLGAGVQLTAGVHLPPPGAARSSVAASPARFGENVQVALAGEAGDLALLTVALAPGYLVLPAKLDPYLLDVTTTVLLPVGAVSADGALALTFPTAPIAAVLAVDLWLQGLHLSTALERFLGAPTAVTLLDAGF